MGSQSLTMVGLTLGLVCLIAGQTGAKPWTNQEKEEINDEYWRTVLDIFKDDKNTDEEEARHFLNFYNNEKLLLKNAEELGNWNYSTNITKHNDILSQQASARLEQFEAESIALA